MNKEDFSIVFVYPNIYTQFSQHEGIQTLSAILKNAGYKNIHLVHIHPKYGIPVDEDRIIKEIEGYNPNLIAFTSTTFEYKFCNKLVGRLKAIFPETLIILGGIHATIKHGDQESSNFDAFCIGEGDIQTLDLVEKLTKDEDWRNTKGFWFKQSKDILKNELQPFVTDLNTLPMQDWDLIDVDKLLEARDGWLSLIFSRGCPYSCTFCINNTLRQIKGHKNYCRMVSVDTAIGELKYLAERFRGKIKVFNLDDDQLTSHRKWITDFSKKYKREIYDKYGIDWKIESRVDSIDEEMVRAMKESGLREMQFGVETANQQLRDTLKKHTTNEQIRNAFKICRDVGIKTMSFIIIGIPNETEDTIKETMDLLIEIKTDLIRPSFLLPIYGTEIYNDLTERKMLKIKNINDIVYGRPIVRLEHITEKVLSNYVILFPWHMNARMGLKDYEIALEKFKNFDYEDLKGAFPKILKMDEELDKKTKPTHYRYFLKNLYYVERVG